MAKDYQTHVFTCTYTADVSGVCSAMYELGGMSVLHDPSGCNSTYSTHDEPRWYDTKSLMFISGLDEIGAIYGDDSIVINDTINAAKDLHPRFITLCGASIPHIIAFDYKGAARLIEKGAGVPVIPVETDGLRSYTSGVSKAFTAWIQRFADPNVSRNGSINLLGVTPLDFSVNGNVEAMVNTFKEAGFKVNACMAMNDTFDNLINVCRASVNVVVSSAGRGPAQWMYKTKKIPYVEGLPIGNEQSEHLFEEIRQTLKDGQNRKAYDLYTPKEEFTVEPDGICVIGEEVFARSLCYGINALHPGVNAYPLYFDEDRGLPEEQLIRSIRSSKAVIGDPLYKVVCHKDDIFIPFAHEAYSGRMFRKEIPVFAHKEFDIQKLIYPAI